MSSKVLAGIIFIGIITIILYLIGSFIESSFDFLIWNKILKSVLAIVWFILFFSIWIFIGWQLEEENKTLELGKEFILSDEELIETKDSVLKEKYISFFKTYCNEDWNRNTPFIKEIEILSYYFSHSNTDKVLYPLNKKIKEIPITKELMEDLKNVFKDDLTTILEMPLGKALMFVADLKSYQEGSSENGDKSPREFYNWRLNVSRCFKK
ncbi:hypothetical protein [Capnocytophaga canis]|uniref:hypothetical protein n=1 Tax=Capnocytophaga canis TaxID=1848903 RepID=UPI0038594EAD